MRGATEQRRERADNAQPARARANQGDGLQVARLIVGIAGAAAIGYAVVAVLVHIVGADRWLPAQLNTLVLTALGLAVLVARDRYARLVEAQARAALVADMMGESYRQYCVIKGGLIDLGARLADNTGEIRRLADDSRPAIDPAVMRLIGELDRQLGRGPDGRLYGRGQ